MSPSVTQTYSRILFLALVALLPLHTIFLRYEIAWKPWLILLAIVAVLDIWAEKRFPWSRRAALGVGIFLAAMLVSWPGVDAGSTFWRLLLALTAGALLLLVTGRHATSIDEVLKVVFWSGTALAASAFVVSLVTNGVFGAGAVDGINDLPLVERVNKPAYLSSRFIPLTNWHQDPGYSALWTNLWLSLSIVAVGRGLISVPRWVPPLVIGGLGVATLLTFARTGWAGLVVAVVAAIFALWRQSHESLRRGLVAVAWGAVVGLGLLGFHLAVDPSGVGGDVDEALEFRLAHLFVLGQIDVGEEGVIDPDLIVDDNRLEVWAEYWTRFTESPWRGIGLGTGWAEVGLQEPHNLGLQLLAETGIIGLLGFLALLFSLGRGGGATAGAALFVVGAAGLTQTVLFEPVLWFALGLCLAGTSKAANLHVEDRVAYPP